MRSFCVAGGDNRIKAAAEFLSAAGYTIKYYGNSVVNDDAVLLPMPLSRDGITVNGNEDIKLVGLARNLRRGQTIFGGIMPAEFTNLLSLRGIEWYDYGKNEALLLENAKITAEAAICLAGSQSDKAFLESSCLIIGCGRIGKNLCMRLLPLSARVTVTARKQADFDYLRNVGVPFAKTDDIREIIGNYDYVFNTVPQPVVTYEALENAGDDILILELASGPGGVDEKAAKELSRKVITALGLPGKYAPKTAGELISKTVLQAIEERKYRWT